MAGGIRFIITTVGRQRHFFAMIKRQLNSRVAGLASHKGGTTDGHEYCHVYDSIIDFNRPINRENKKVIHPAVWRRGWIILLYNTTVW